MLKMGVEKVIPPLFGGFNLLLFVELPGIEPEPHIG